MTTRRNFIKDSSLACVSLCGIGTILVALVSCKSSFVSHAIVENNEIRVPLESFVERKIIIVKNSQLKFKVAVIKKTESEFYAIEMRCSHQENAVQYNGKGFFCPSHGSTFSIEGKVLEEPATENLKKMKARIIEDKVLVRL